LSKRERQIGRGKKSGGKREGQLEEKNGGGREELMRKKREAIENRRSHVGVVSGGLRTRKETPAENIPHRVRRH